MSSALSDTSASLGSVEDVSEVGGKALPSHRRRSILPGVKFGRPIEMGGMFRMVRQAGPEFTYLVANNLTESLP